VLGLTADDAEKLAVVVVIALVLLAALFAKVLIGNLAKIAAAVVLVAAAIFVWSQRTSLQDCATTVRESAAPGATGSATCTVSGIDFTVDLNH
jgi:predicted aspartyl protease